jgi:hypothetical protein
MGKTVCILRNRHILPSRILRSPDLPRCILPTFSTEVIKHFYEQVCIGCDSGGIQRTVGQLAGYPQCEAGVMSGRS